jgi:hypothetical protein
MTVHDIEWVLTKGRYGKHAIARNPPQRIFDAMGTASGQNPRNMFHEGSL